MSLFGMVAVSSLILPLNLGTRLWCHAHEVTWNSFAPHEALNAGTGSVGVCKHSDGQQDQHDPDSGPYEDPRSW
jgi:hypothetical protein